MSDRVDRLRKDGWTVCGTCGGSGKVTAVHLAPRQRPQEGTVSHSMYFSFAEAMKTAQRSVHNNSKAKGWFDSHRTFGDFIALVHSELSEALEDFRHHHAPTEVWFEGDKPCGIPIELADVVIRVMDMCEFYGIDLGSAIEQKHAYNRTRPERHGDKAL